jgi:hypothetical protein
MSDSLTRLTEAKKQAALAHESLYYDNALTAEQTKELARAIVAIEKVRTELQNAEVDY